MTVVGGLRLRLLHDSVHDHLESALTALDWFDPSRSHVPIRLLAKPLRWDVPIEPNMITISFDEARAEEVEVGSDLTTGTLTAYIDIYAESDSLGVDISNDIRDLFRGRLVATHPTVGIYDYRQATPPIIGYATVASVISLRNDAISQELWMRHWFRVRCELEDTYYSSEV